MDLKPEELDSGNKRSKGREEFQKGKRSRGVICMFKVLILIFGRGQ
jgi:hypothetical protein